LRFGATWEPIGRVRARLRDRWDLSLHGSFLEPEARSL
jgi:hypothetical protein